MRTISAALATTAKRQAQPIGEVGTVDSPFNEELAALDVLSPKELRPAWHGAYGFPAPNLSPALLRAGIGWQLQANRYGGHSKGTLRLLSSDNGSGAAQRLAVGTRLVRDWHGTGHSVTVLEDGFEYDGKSWRSLTAIARHITGARWSGPRFFGIAA